jgi:peptidoglycan/LPS O-acetylase OafA/YrhL
MVAQHGIAIQNSNRLHFRSVDGFRGLAALYVVLHHAWMQTWPKTPYGDVPTGWTLALTGWLQYGKFGVIVFIVISGFCLALPVLGNEGSFGAGGARRFFERRARRILPPYYVALLLSILLVAGFIPNVTHSNYDASLPMTTAGIVSHFLLIHNLRLATLYQINGPMWSIAVECQIYLVFPLLIAVRRRGGIAAVLLWAFIAACALHMLVHDTQFEGLEPLFLFFFALGMYAAEVAVGPARRRFLWVACAAVALQVGVSLMPALRESIVSSVLVGIIAMSLLIVCAQWPSNGVARLTAWTPIAMLGTFSYSLYLIHFPIQQVLWKYLVLPFNLGKTLTFCVVATAGTGVIVVFAYGFYWVFERPFCRQRGASRLVEAEATQTP